MGEEKIGETARGTQNCQGEKRLGGVWKWWDRSPGTGLRLWSPAHDSWFCLQTSPINKNPHISLLDSPVPTIPTLLSNHHLWPLPPSSSLSPSSSSSIGGSLLISFLPSDSEGWSVWLVWIQRSLFVWSFYWRLGPTRFWIRLLTPCPFIVFQKGWTSLYQSRHSVWSTRAHGITSP